MANLFSRVGVKNGADRGDVIVYPAAHRGDQPSTAATCRSPPRPLDGPAAAARRARRSPRGVRRLAGLAGQSVLRPRRSSTASGRTSWAAGLVEAVDDIRDANPAVEPGAVRGAHARLRRAPVRRQASGADDHELDDLPALVDADRDNAADLKYHSHYIARRLPAEVILDAISQVTGVGENFPGFPGRRALQLPDAAVDSYFLYRLRTPSAPDGRRFGTPAGTEHHAGAARHQRRHHQPQAERVARPDSGSGDRERG